MKALIDIIHLLKCKKPHCYEPEKIIHRESGICYYYIEEQIANPTALPDHAIWIEEIRLLKLDLNFSTDAELFEFIRTILATTQHLRESIGSSSARKHLALEILTG